MKKFVKGKWFPLTLAAVIAAIIAFILFLFGFRITYSPELDNNWDAVSAVAAWVGVIASFVAIRFAIRVPKQIAKSQNDIALFEKRYQLYKSLRPLINFGNDVLKIKDETLKTMDVERRALRYLMAYVTAKDRDYNEIVDIGLIFKFKYDDTHNFWGYEIRSYLKDLNSYTLRLRQHIYSHQSNIELTSFLFSKDVEELLQRLADSYCNFMNLVCGYSGLAINNEPFEDELINKDAEEQGSNINNKPCRDKSINAADFQTCPMEIRKREFLEVVKEISDKNILGKIEDCLRIKE